MIKKIIISVVLFASIPLSLMNAQWEKIPLYGGHVKRLIQSKFNPKDVFALTAQSGVWYSSDSGDNWRPINGDNNELVGKEVKDLEVAKDNSIFIIAEAQLYRTTDYGNNWLQQKLPEETITVYDSNIETTNYGALFISLWNSKISDTPILRKSTNFGVTWIDIPLPTDVGGHFYDYFLDPLDPDIIFILGYWGILKITVDEGRTWYDCNTFASFKDYRQLNQPKSIFRDGKHLYGMWVYEEKSPGGCDYYESADTGRTWSKINAARLPWAFGSNIILDNGDMLVIGWPNYFRSTDHGINWIEYSNTRTWSILNLQNKIIASSSMIGILESIDNANTWKSVMNRGGFSIFRSIELCAINPNILYTIVQDDEDGSSLYELRASNDRGNTWNGIIRGTLLSNLCVVATPETRYFLIANDNTVLSGIPGQTIPDTLLRWQRASGLGNLVDQYSDLDVSSIDGNQVYVMAYETAGRKIYHSSDAGRTWESSSIGLNIISAFDIQASRSTIGTLYAVSYPTYMEQIYTSDRIWKSTNHGMNWSYQDDGSFILFADDIFYKSNLQISSDNGINWYRNDRGLPDDEKNSGFGAYSSNGNLVIEHSGKWFVFINNQWRRIADDSGNDLGKCCWSSITLLNNDLYITIPYDGLYRFNNTITTTVKNETSERFNSLTIYPNPFRDRTIISLPFQEGEPGLMKQNARIRIVDLLGRTIKQWSVDPHSQTSIVWDGANESGQRFPAGLYLCQLYEGSKIYTRRITIVR